MNSGVHYVQTALKLAGFDPGDADGKWGPKTRTAFDAALRQAKAPAAPQSEPVAPASVVPAEWMPKAKMVRLVAHWTAGSYTPNAVDRKAYHLLIDGDGVLHRGVHSIADNEAPITGAYAAHVGGANSGAIGVSLCCMHGAQESPYSPGRYPMKAEQWDKLVAVLRDLVRRYAIPVRPDTVMTHAEVKVRLGVGIYKWDISVLPFDPSIKGAKAIGDRLRREVASGL